MLNAYFYKITILQNNNVEKGLCLFFNYSNIEEVHILFQLQNQLSGSTAESTLPLQQQLLLCSVAIATNKKAKSDSVAFGKLHSTLTKVWLGEYRHLDRGYYLTIQSRKFLSAIYIPPMTVTMVSPNIPTYSLFVYLKTSYIDYIRSDIILLF